MATDLEVRSFDVFTGLSFPIKDIIGVGASPDPKFRHVPDYCVLLETGEDEDDNR